MEIIVKDLNDLPAAARELLPVLRGRVGRDDGGNVVALYGGMGAGKTTLTAALLRALGSPDDVTSPTFALVNDYLVPASAPINDSLVPPDAGTTPDNARARHVYHFDFYRIDSPSEAFDLGYEEYFYSGELCLVEWPEKIEELLPPDTLRLRIDALPDGARRITLSR